MSKLAIPGLQILNEIGQGGMAKVYLAVQESLQRPVAVKLLNNPDSPRFHERFMNEGRYLAALSHSNTVEVYDVGESEGHYYILMEYLPGGDLKRRIRRGIKPATAIKLTVRIANCLDYLHHQGIVHRDLKPSNILFRADNNPVLTDFGIAKLLQETSEHTQQGVILGSPPYLSPEQAGFSGVIDGRSDLYSLGVILYEMLTGQRPFKGENLTAILMAHHKQPIPKLPEHLSRFQPIIERLMAKQPDERFQTGQALIQAIRTGPVAKAHKLRRRSDMQLEPSPQLTLVEPRPPQQEPPPVSRQPWRVPFLVGLIIGLLPVSLLEQSEWVELNLDAEARTEAVNLEQSPQTADLAVEPVEAQAPAQPQTQPKPKPKVRKIPRVNPKLSKSDQLLSLAYQRMKSLRLSYPKGDNALKYFRDTLALEPDNIAAQAGIRQIVRWYIREADEALAQGDVERAARYVQRGRRIDHKHPKLVALQEKLEADTPSK
jgi:serine/threonine protein kinase